MVASVHGRARGLARAGPFHSQREPRTAGKRRLAKDEGLRPARWRTSWSTAPTGRCRIDVARLTSRRLPMQHTHRHRYGSPHRWRTPASGWVTAAAGLLARGSMPCVLPSQFPSGFSDAGSPLTVAGAAAELAPRVASFRRTAFPFDPLFSGTANCNYGRR